LTRASSPTLLDGALRGAEEKERAKVVLFSTTTCSWCRRAKKYFKESRVPFREVNVERDASAARMIRKQTGQTGVPVIKIGSKWIVGFDQPAIERERARRT
jgi:glutaredoxin 3